MSTQPLSPTNDLFGEPDFDEPVEYQEPRMTNVKGPEKQALTLEQVQDLINKTIANQPKTCPHCGKEV